MGLKKLAKKVHHGIKESVKGPTSFLVNPVRAVGRPLLKDTSVGRRLESAEDTAVLGIKDAGKEFLDNPVRLLAGSVDPASTKFWNTILGRHDRPLVNMYGSPTEDTYQHAEEKGINTKGARDFFKIGDSIAGYFGGSAAMGGIDKAFGASNLNVPGLNGAKTAGAGSPASTAGTGGFSMPNTASGWMDLAGNAYGLYSAYNQQKNANKIGKEANPFAKYRELYGDELLKSMMDPNAFEDDPAYQWQREQGLEAVTRKMASQGFTGSTNMATGLIDYAEGLASTYRGQQLDRLAGLAGANIGPASRASVAPAQSAAFDEFSDILASIGYRNTRDTPTTGPTNPLEGITGSGGGRNMGPW